jgi:hypothetical protein
MNLAVPLLVILVLKLAMDFCLVVHHESLIPLSWLIWHDTLLDGCRRYSKMVALWSMIMTIFSFPVATRIVFAKQIQPAQFTLAFLRFNAGYIAALAAFLGSIWCSSWFLLSQFGPL